MRVSTNSESVNTAVRPYATHQLASNTGTRPTWDMNRALDRVPAWDRNVHSRVEVVVGKTELYTPAEAKSGRGRGRAVKKNAMGDGPWSDERGVAEGVVAPAFVQTTLARRRRGSAPSGESQRTGRRHGRLEL